MKFEIKVILIKYLMDRESGEVEAAFHRDMVLPVLPYPGMAIVVGPTCEEVSGILYRSSDDIVECHLEPEVVEADDSIDSVVQSHLENGWMPSEETDPVFNSKDEDETGQIDFGSDVELDLGGEDGQPS